MTTTYLPTIYVGNKDSNGTLVYEALYTCNSQEDLQEVSAFLNRRSSARVRRTPRKVEVVSVDVPRKVAHISPPIQPGQVFDSTHDLETVLGMAYNGVYQALNLAERIGASRARVHGLVIRYVIG